MKVILKQDIRGTGKKGQVLEVADGYARNFLLKRGLAIVADNAAMSELKSKEAAAAHRVEMEKQAASELAKALEGKTLKIKAKAGAGGKLFGSVTSKEVSEEIKKQLGFDVDKRKIALESEIKAFGTYTAEIKLYTAITAKLYVMVGEE